MLDERSRSLLKTLVEHYIAEGQPVGSRVLSRVSGLDLSPAVHPWAVATPRARRHASRGRVRQHPVGIGILE